MISIVYCLNKFLHDISICFIFGWHLYFHRYWPFFCLLRHQRPHHHHHHHHLYLIPKRSISSLFNSKIENEETEFALKHYQFVASFINRGRRELGCVKSIRWWMLKSLNCWRCSTKGRERQKQRRRRWKRRMKKRRAVEGGGGKYQFDKFPHWHC